MQSGFAMNSVGYLGAGEAEAFEGTGPRLTYAPTQDDRHFDGAFCRRQEIQMVRTCSRKSASGRRLSPEIHHLLGLGQAPLKTRSRRPHHRPLDSGSRFS
jgi:hypothetical protein